MPGHAHDHDVDRDCNGRVERRVWWRGGWRPRPAAPGPRPDARHDGAGEQPETDEGSGDAEGHMSQPRTACRSGACPLPRRPVRPAPRPRGSRRGGRAPPRRRRPGPPRCGWPGEGCPPPGTSAGGSTWGPVASTLRHGRTPGRASPTGLGEHAARVPVPGDAHRASTTRPFGRTSRMTSPKAAHPAHAVGPRSAALVGHGRAARGPVTSPSSIGLGVGTPLQGDAQAGSLVTYPPTRRYQC